MIYDNGSHLDDLAEKVSKTVEALRRRRKHFDSIVVRGNSGVIVGSPVALRLRVPLVVVRKPGEGSHSSHKVINVGNLGDRWLFLDDFISTGRTLRACIEALESYDSRHACTYQYDRPAPWPNWRIEHEPKEII
jgi:adenine/guanine phosphoribosyltransferase-like PRPP-binding protein